MKLNYLYLEKSFLGVLMAIFSLYLTDCLAKDISSKKKMIRLVYLLIVMTPYSGMTIIQDTKVNSVEF